MDQQAEVIEELGRRGFTDIFVAGRGGFSTVFRAEQPAYGRTVALKVLRLSYLDPVAFERFERERRAMGSMSSHPNILTIYQGGVTRQGEPYLVMEWAPRGSVVDRLGRRGPVPWPEAVQAGVKLAGALETAHRGGVMHRDVKPENVLLSSYGEPLLTDFGIARITGGIVTTSNVMKASVAHAPPEVLNGRSPSAASDVYSLASTIVTMIAGRPPFYRDSDDSVASLWSRIASEPPPDLRPRGVPDQVCRALERALAKSAAMRPSSPLAFAEELRGAQRSVGQLPTHVPLGSDDDVDAEELDGPVWVSTPVPSEPPAPPPAPAPLVVEAPDELERPQPSRTVRRVPPVAVVGAVAAALLVVAAGIAVFVSARGGDTVAAPGDVLAVGDTLFAVTADEEGQRVVEVDPSNTRVGLSSESGGFPLSTTAAIDVDGTSTWALTTHGQGVRAYEVEEAAETLAVGTPSPTLAGDPVALEVAEGSVWVLHGTTEGLSLAKFDIDDPGRLEAEADLNETDAPEGEVRGSLAVGPFGAWATDGSRTITRFERDLGERLDIELPARALAMAADDERVWVATDDGRVLRFDGHESSFEDYDVADGADLTSIAVGEDVWVAADDGRVWRLDKGDDRVAQLVDVPEGDGATALAVGGGYLWFLLDDEAGTLGRVSLDTGARDLGVVELSDALEDVPEG